jgi:hypothetical protein
MSVDLPATIWQNPNQSIEPTVGDANDIVDPSANTLVDPSGNQIIDTGVEIDSMPATAWEEDDDI